MESVYNQVMDFKRKYPSTLTHHRLRKHAEIIEKHLNPGEVVTYAFAAQKNTMAYDIFETAVIAITNERLLIGQKRVLFGYFLNSITPDLYNDMQVRSGLIWGGITVDTVKEKVELSNISKKALPEIETKITSFMMEAKKQYARREDSK
jgi:hypothetical protein